MKAAIHTLLAMAATTSTAFAANGAQADEPGILMWAFMGFCAVILAGQLVPAVMMLYGTAKALFTEAEEPKKKFY